MRNITIIDRAQTAIQKMIERFDARERYICLLVQTNRKPHRCVRFGPTQMGIDGRNMSLRTENLALHGRFAVARRDSVSYNQGDVRSIHEGNVNSSTFIQDLRELALDAGADFFGIADLAAAQEAVLAQGGESLAEFERAVAIGVALPDDIVDRLAQQDNAGVAQQYEKIYDETNRKLDQIAAIVAEHLRNAGAKALAVQASHIIDQQRLCGLFSHKLAAHLAGLGWIGKSCLFITQKRGPRVRWATVLTNAQLPSTGGPMKQACGECRQCVAACPVQAFTGEPFREKECRGVRFNAQKCHEHLAYLSQKFGSRAFCGLCVSVCPYGNSTRRPKDKPTRNPKGRASA